MSEDHEYEERPYACNVGECDRTFSRRYDLKRHKLTHCPYEERPFGCPAEGCKFRANQKTGLKCHYNGVHRNLRIPCGQPRCSKTFSEPSGLWKHREHIHGIIPPSRKTRRQRPRKKKSSAPRRAAVRAPEQPCYSSSSSPRPTAPAPSSPSPSNGSNFMTSSLSGLSSTAVRVDVVFHINNEQHHHAPKAITASNEVANTISAIEHSKPPTCESYQVQDTLVLDPPGSHQSEVSQTFYRRRRRELFSDRVLPFPGLPVFPNRSMLRPNLGMLFN